MGEEGTRTKAECGEQVFPGYQSMLKVPGSWLTAWVTWKASEGGWRDTHCIGQARKARPASFPITIPCSHTTQTGMGVSLPLPGMKTSTGLLKGPTPPLVTAATRTEQVALVATTGRIILLVLCRASAEPFCWREQGKSLSWERQR